MLLLVAAPEDAERAHHLRWSLWRRRHQAVARQGHRVRRAHRRPPAQPGAAPRRGRPSGDLRRQLEGMLAVMHRGGPWREVPPACGPWQTIYARYALWIRTGLWDRIAAILHPDLAQTEPAAAP